MTSGCRQIRHVHAKVDGTNGQLKVWEELNESGIAVARCTTERLTRRHGTCGIGPAKGKKNDSAGVLSTLARHRHCP